MVRFITSAKAPCASEEGAAIRLNRDRFVSSHLLRASPSPIEAACKALRIKSELSQPGKPHKH